MLENAGKNPKNPDFGFFFAGKCWKNPKNPVFGFFCWKMLEKNPKWDFFPALVLTTFGNTFLIYYIFYIFHILLFFS